MTSDEVLALIRERVEAADTAKSFASKIGLSASYISDVLSKRRPLAKSILDAVGFQEIVTYEPKRGRK